MKKKLPVVLLMFILGCLLILGYGLTSEGVTREPEDSASDNAGLAGTQSESLLSDWAYRKAHNISGTTAGAQTNYTMVFNVHYDNRTDFHSHVYLNGNCRTDFGDIRFTNSSENEFDCWMQTKVDGIQATFWVEIDYIPPSPNYTTIYIYYGNPNATTTSNGFNTFLIFDDFEDSNWTDRWEEVENYGTVDESGGILTLETADGGGNNYIVLSSKSNFTGQTIELMSLLEHTRHWDRGGYLEICIRKEPNTCLASAPWDGDVNQIRASEEYQGSYAYTRITDVILTKNHLHQLTFRGTDTENYVDYYDIESDVHHVVTHTYSQGFTWDSQSVYDIRLVNWHWSTESGGDGYQTDRYYWLAVRKYASPEPTHGSPGPEISKVEWNPTCPPPYLPSNVTRTNEPVLITAYSKGSKALLSYRVDGGEWWNTTMTYNFTTDLWTAIIPGQPNGTENVEFFITAYDNSENSATSSTYSFNVKSLIVGDINGDGKVDMRDIGRVARNFGKTSS